MTPSKIRKDPKFTYCLSLKKTISLIIFANIFYYSYSQNSNTDVFMWRDGSKSWTVNLSTGTGFNMYEWKGAWGSDGPINTGDLNGDGKTDVFMWRDGSKSWMVNLSTGTGFNMYEWKGAWGSDGPVNVGDLNGDGKTDVFMWRDGSKSWTVNLSTGTGFNMYEWKGAWGSDGLIYTGDLNRDGKTDADGDGITDDIEARLLSRFRPYYRFSLDGGEDDQHPADAKWFVQHSELYDHHIEQGTPVFGIEKLKSDPSLILKANSIGPSDVRLKGAKSDYYLNLYNDFRGGDPDWNHIKSSAVGLYGHVAPLHEDVKSPNKNTAYKIEYWQFYAHDNAGAGPASIHEGDWESVQLIVENDATTIRRVRHYIHDTYVDFDLKMGVRVDIGNGFVEFQGTETGKPYRGYIDLNVHGPAGIGWAQNNLVRFFCENGECTHPVVYIEHGGHASWPTEHWNWPTVDNHNGSSHAYLVATPPNLGEIGHSNPNCPGADLVLYFNGHWGAYGDGPEGPTIKADQWGKK